VFALDSSVWCHQRAQTLESLLYEYSPMPSSQTSMVQGHPDSILACVPEAGRGSALPMHTERVSEPKNAVQTGVNQVTWLCQQRAACAGVPVGGDDGRYGNHHFLGGLAQAECAVPGRLCRDRVLSGPAPPYRGRGRPPIHGARFAFKDPST
jgi:hypothetical protein